MENKETITSGKMTESLIGNWLLWGILFGLGYSLIFSIITSKIDSIVLKAIIAIVFQGIIALLLWKVSTSSSFKKKTISYNDVPKVMKNLVIFTIIICVITAIYNFSNVNSSLDKAINSDVSLKYSEMMMSYFYDDSQMSEYQKQKEEIIKETKSKLYTYLVILEIGLTAVYLAVLPFEKKEILKYVE